MTFPLNVFVPLQLLLVVVPKAREIVLAVFDSGYVNVRAACLAEKVDQSLALSRPSDDALAVGMFNVCVDPTDENPNPPFDDVVAKV